MTDTTDAVEDTSTAYVVYVPANGSDTTVESCLRLGAGPSSQSTTDETTTYSNFVKASNALSGLSASHYNTHSGIALVTPGAINLLAAGGVNTTSGSYTNSTIGSSYTVTQDPTTKEIVSANYTNNNYGLWTTASFSQEASNVAVNTIPLQASLQLGVSYSLSGPLSFANSCGASFNSAIGWSVSAQLARSVAIGWRTAVSYAADGSNNEYYTKAQASNTGAGFSWTVPAAGPSYLAFDAMQETWCKLVNKAALASNVVAALYAVSGASIALDGSPAAVQTWLKGAEPIAIICTTINAILGAMGLVLGYMVDQQAGSVATQVGATTFDLGAGRAVLKTKASIAANSAPILTLDANSKQIVLATNESSPAAPKLLLDGTGGLIGLGKGVGGPQITMGDQFVLQLGTTSSIVLNATGITLASGGHTISIGSGGIAIAGTTITIDGTTSKIGSLETQISNVVQGLAEVKDAAQQADLALAATDMLTSEALEQATAALDAAKKAAEAAAEALNTAKEAALAATTNV